MTNRMLCRATRSARPRRRESVPSEQRFRKRTPAAGVPSTSTSAAAELTSSHRYSPSRRSAANEHQWTEPTGHRVCSQHRVEWHQRRSRRDGLRIISSGVNVQFLAVNGFAGDGFEVGGAGEASIVANFIGLATDEQSAAGNGGHGIHHASNSTGSSFIHANRIGFNGGDGIYVSSGFANINPQTIYLNDGLGIDLGPDGVTPNDPLDADSGPNNLQNFPVLTSAVISGSSPAVLTVDGTLHSSPNKFVLIDFFADADPCDPAVIEGRRPLGGSALTTDSQGNASFSESIELVPGTVINSVTATTRVFPLYTSEFSPCVPVSGGPSPT